MNGYLDGFLPAFGLIALGAFLKRRLITEDAVWAGIEKLVFWVLLPCLLVSSIAPLKLAELPLGRLAAVIWLVIPLCMVAALALAQLARTSHASMTSVLMGGIRFNQLMGFAVVGALFGPQGLALSAVATGLMVPMAQTLTTVAFAVGPTSGGRRFSPRRVLGQVVRNPMLLGCVVGFVVSALGGLPHGISPLVRTLGQASVALGLLSVGAALSIATLRARALLQVATGAIKLLLMPALAWAIGTALGLEPLPLAIAVVFTALPTAPTSYVMARAMGGDAPLMAAITTLEHAAAALTLPLWIALLGW